MQTHSSGACRLWIAFPETITQEVAASSGSQNSPSYLYIPGWGDVPLGTGGQSSGSASATVQITSFGTPEPLGTCERFPQIIDSVEYEEWYTDRGGFKKSDDLLFAGKDALVGGVLTRYRESVYRRLAESPRYGQTGIRADLSGDVGSMVIRERKNVVLWVQFDYGGGGPFAVVQPLAKPVHVAGSMPAGYRFPGALWRGPTRHSTGTAPKKIQFLFLCHRVILPSGAYVCADEDMSAVQGRAWEVVP